MTGNGPVPWEISDVVVDIKHWVVHRQWSFVWIPREENRLAHRVAKAALAGNLPSNWLMSLL